MKLNHNYSSRFRILKGGKISLIVSALFGSAILSFASPSGGVVTSGNASINQVGKTTNINQSTSKASINWQKFGIKADEVVNFIQPDKNSITLNRVIGNERSIIDGALNANGQVWILNSNGVLFGKNASINTSGLLATTKNLSDTDFQSGNYNFSGDSTESIINQGTIKIKDNGYVILASNEVRNFGEIEAVKGRVQLTSADEYTINLNGNSLVDLVVDKGVLDALVENSGTILADGGEVYLTTHAVDELLRGVVNNTGIIEANSLDGISGHAELFAHGGEIQVGGEIRAKDGFVETSGKFFSFNDAKIEAGEWLIDPVDVTIDATLANAIQSQLASGDMTIETVGAGADDGDITVNSDITWSTTNRLTLNADDQVIMNAKIENTNNSEGEVYFIANNGVVFNAGGKVVINNIHQLQAVDTALNGTYELGSNIDASDTRNWGSGAGFNPLGDNTTQFTGNFDGKGYIIDGLYINRPSEDYVGLFGYANGATISNLGLTNLYVKGDWMTGGFIGASNNNTSISNSYAIGEVIGSSYVGGLIGNAYINTTINNSYTNTTISSNTDGGGLVGTAHYDLKIFNSYAIGKINSGGYKGGLLGYSNSLSNVITNSYWDIDTTGQTIGVGFLGSYSPGSFTGIYSSTNTVNAFNQATYAGFDFTNDWFMIEGETRPFLRSEYSTTITNDHQLQLMAMDLSANYTLANDIKYTGNMWSSKGFDPIGDDSTYFTGNFDGKSHVIDGLYINRGSENNIGLFGQNWSSKSISNLGLTNVDITGRYDVGGLVGDALALTINNSYVTGTINGNNSVGGLMGYANDNTSITNSYTSVNLTGNNNLGGLLGYKDSSSNLSISDSYTTGSINGNSNLGGLVGNVAANASTISNSYSTATVSGSGQLIGGLVGRLYPSTSQNNISNSYASGDVSGDDNVGGLVGYSYRGQINNSYSSGNVSGDDNIGGLVGNVYGTTINNTYSSGDVTGNHKVGGLVGFYDGYETISNSYASGAITGVSRVGGVVGALSSTASIFNPILNSYWDIDTTGQALGVGDGDTAGTTGIYSSTNTINAFDEATYANFDFTNDWIIYEGHTRPLLRTFMTDLTVKANDHTRTYDGTTYSGSAGVTYSIPTYDSSLVYGTLNYTSSDDLKNAGTATIGVDGLYSSQHGYIINYDTGTLTTNKKNITVTGNSKTTTYDGTTQTSNGFTASGLVSGETIAVLDGVTGDSVSGKNAGTYNTNLSGTDENYNLTFQNGSLVINKKALSLEASKEYDGTADLTGFVSFGNLVGNETLEYAGATANSKKSGNDNFISNITLKDGENGGLASNYELPSLLANSSNNRVSIGAKPDLTTVITPIANKIVLTNKDIDTLVKNGIDIKTILQQVNNNEFFLIPGIVMKVLNGGINLPFGSKQEFNLDNNKKEEENTI